MPFPAAAAAAYRSRPLETLVAMSDPGRRRPPRFVAKVLVTSRLPDNFVGALSARFRVTSLDGTPLLTDLRKGGGDSTRSSDASLQRRPRSRGWQS